MREKYMSLRGSRKCARRDRPTRNVSCRVNAKLLPACGPWVTVNTRPRPSPSWAVFADSDGGDGVSMLARRWAAHTETVGSVSLRRATRIPVVPDRCENTRYCPSGVHLVL